MGLTPTDETNYVQSLMHLIKGNIGAGILAMPSTFAHCGLINGLIGLPILCFVAVYCAHLLIKSSRHLERKMMWRKMDYAQLAEGAFKTGPRLVRSCSGALSALTNVSLMAAQMGMCCAYLVFIVDNLHHITITYTHRDISKYYFFVAIYPFILWLSCIRTLNRLALASTVANCLQVVGIVIILQHLIREMPEEVATNHDKPLSEMALGFGSAVFALEGISVLLPLYKRMKQPNLVRTCCGVINTAYAIILVLYVSVGFLGYLKYGEESRGSITLNLPSRPLFEAVRVLYTLAIALTFPLQMYVPSEIVWHWAQTKFELDEKTVPPMCLRLYECLSRLFLVTITFSLSMTVPHLHLIMDLVGSMACNSVTFILPTIIHLSAFWNDTSGGKKFLMAVLDAAIIIVGTTLGTVGAYSSALLIYETFGTM